MRRRDVLTLLGGAAVAWPFAIQAQTAKVRRIFWVSTESQPDPFVDGFREGLHERGYVEGKDVILELRYAPGNPDALRHGPSRVDTRQGGPRRVKRSCHSRDAGGDRYSRAVCHQRRSGQIGLVKSLARPGGNFTGSTFLSLDLAAKRVDLLKDIFPKLRRLAVLSNTDHPGERLEWNATQQAAQKLGIEPVYVPFVGVQELDNALATVGRCARGRYARFP